MPARPRSRRAAAGPRIPDERLWQVGFLVGSVLGAAATVAGRRVERSRARGRARRLAAGRADRDRPAALRAGHARPPTSCGPPRRDYADGDGAASCRPCRSTSAPSCRASSSGSRVVDRAGWVRANTAAFAGAHRHARGRAARPDAAAGARARQGDDGPRQPLGDDPPARPPARVHGPAGPRPVRPRAAVRRGDARPAAVRRGEHPPDGAGAGRAARRRSGPGSRSTRRPTRSSSRPTPGSGRTSPTASSASCRCSRRDAASLGREAVGRSAPRSAATAGATTSTGSSA